jgi:hypothetical protein
VNELNDLSDDEIRELKRIANIRKNTRKVFRSPLGLFAIFGTPLVSMAGMILIDNKILGVLFMCGCFAVMTVVVTGIEKS